MTNSTTPDSKNKTEMGHLRFPTPLDAEEAMVTSMGSHAGFIGLLELFGLVVVGLYAIAPLMLFAINRKLARLVESQKRIADYLETHPAQRAV